MDALIDKIQVFFFNCLITFQLYGVRVKAFIYISDDNRTGRSPNEAASASRQGESCWFRYRPEYEFSREILRRISNLHYERPECRDVVKPFGQGNQVVTCCQRILRKKPSDV